MIDTHPGTRLHEISYSTVHHSSFEHHVVVTHRRSPAAVGVYVAHPITGIRMSRILAMQDTVRSLLDEVGRDAGLDVLPLFPMRTTHLSADGIGDNVYDAAAGDFSHPTHYTLQNRMDAIVHSDGVLVNYDMTSDDGTFRISNGIPFDVGWAAATGRPTAIVQPDDNPNQACALSTGQTRHQDLETGIRSLVDRVVARDRLAEERTVAEIIVFPTTRCADALAALAPADVRRHRDGCRAILVVMPGMDENCNRHGQVGVVADWMVPDIASARSIVDRLSSV